MNGKALFIACLFLLAVQALAQNTPGPTLKSYCPFTTFGGTGNGARCATQWTYKGITYNNECTSRDHFRPWCSTTEGAFVEKWGNCDPDANCPYFCSNFTTKGTARGAACVFPFTYKGNTYRSCTTQDHFRHWCSVTPNFSNRWGNCEYDAGCAPSHCQDRTYLGTAYGAPCVIPFTYKGVTYNACTRVNHFRDWCSTTSVFSGRWGNCIDKSCPPLCTRKTEGGSAGEAPCIFPFVYKGVEYDRCTTIDNNNKFWCSTTPIFNKRWGNCIFANSC